MTEKLNAKKQSLEQTAAEQAKEVCLHSQRSIVLAKCCSLSALWLCYLDYF